MPGLGCALPSGRVMACPVKWAGRRRRCRGTRPLSRYGRGDCALRRRGEGAAAADARWTLDCKENRSKTIDALIRGYLALLEGAAADPDRFIADLPLPAGAG